MTTAQLIIVIALAWLPIGAMVFLLTELIPSSNQPPTTREIIVWVLGWPFVLAVTVGAVLFSLPRAVIEAVKIIRKKRANQ